jgi:hypothetical protein
MQLLPYGKKNKSSMEKMVIKGRENWDIFTASLFMVEH